MDSLKRVCLTLDLKNNKDLINAYTFYHRTENHWDEINEGIKAAGISHMEIYLVDNRMFMICDIDADADFNKIWKKIRKYPRQREWTKLMNNYTQSLPGHKLEWVQMEKIFSLR